MSVLELLVCSLLILCSAYVSASEIALFSLSRFQLRFLKENFRTVHRKIKRLLSDPGGLLITILVVNEVLNIALSARIAKFISKSHYAIPNSLGNFPRWAFEAILEILITSPIVLFLCEATPKVIGARANKLVATATVGGLTFIYKLFKPVRFLLKHLIRFLLSSIYFIFRNKKNEPQNQQNSTILKESDFILLVEEGHKEGAIQENELELIKNVFELDNTTIAEVSTPLSQVLSLSVHTSLKEALIAVRSQRYSRIPIIGSNKKEVVGVLYSKDLLRSKLQPEISQTTVATLMRKPYFVYPTMKLNSLFRNFKQRKTHMAIVKNTTGEVTGLVTMSDVLDALFEDFFTDDEEIDSLGVPPQPNSHLRKV